MTAYKTGTHEQWPSARLDLLKTEKEGAPRWRIFVGRAHSLTGLRNRAVQKRTRIFLKDELPEWSRNRTHNGAGLEAACSGMVKGELPDVPSMFR
jgi:hypothetical protein